MAKGNGRGRLTSTARGLTCCCARPDWGAAGGGARGGMAEGRIGIGDRPHAKMQASGPFCAVHCRIRRGPGVLSVIHAPDSKPWGGGGEADIGGDSRSDPGGRPLGGGH